MTLKRKAHALGTAGWTVFQVALCNRCSMTLGRSTLQTHRAKPQDENISFSTGWQGFWCSPLVSVGMTSHGRTVSGSDAGKKLSMYVKRVVSPLLGKSIT